MDNSYNLIIGDGAVGTALADVFGDSRAVGIHYEPQGNPQVIHIALPYNEKSFEKEVKRYIDMYRKRGLEYVIIHSTVRVGITFSISISYPSTIHFVYSPVVGQHGNLPESLRTFDKWYATCCDTDSVFIEDYFRAYGITPVKRDSWNATEMAKLLATTRHAMEISFAQEQERLCKRKGLHYEEVVTEFEKMFNVGSLEMGQSEKMRPMIFPGIIGGACLMPNIKILRKMFRSPFLDLIEESNERKKKSN